MRESGLTSRDKEIASARDLSLGLGTPRSDMPLHVVARLT
jgi:hypothetical protein